VLLLALDTATPAVTVALLADGEVRALDAQQRTEDYRAQLAEHQRREDERGRPLGSERQDTQLQRDALSEVGCTT